jgi:hypothetical protein
MGVFYWTEERRIQDEDSTRFCRRRKITRSLERATFLDVLCWLFVVLNLGCGL